MFTQTPDQQLNSMIIIMLNFHNRSKTDLARAVGISKQHLNRLLKNNIEWKWKHAARAMLFLGFEPHDVEERFYTEELNHIFESS